MVDCITRQVFERPLRLAETQRYISIQESERSEDTRDSKVEKIRAFLRAIRSYARPILQEGKYAREVNYEDLLYLCRMIRNDLVDRVDTPTNPAIRPFSERMWADARSSFLESPNQGDDDQNEMNDLAYTADEAAWLISGVVREALNKPVDADQLETSFQPLLDALGDNDVDRVTIVTLNHDLLVERLLTKKGIEYTDGFGSQNGELRFFEPSRLFESSRKVRLIKPHGSIDWYRVRRRDHHNNQERLALTSSDNPDRFNDAQGREYKADRPEPIILAGSEKEKAYQDHVFGEMLEAMLQALHQTNTVIESGFGWQDYGMSSILMRYLNRSDENKLLMLHEKDNLYKEDSHREDDSYEGIPLPGDNPFSATPEGLITLSKYMSKTSWDDIKEALGLPKSEEA